MHTVISALFIGQSQAEAAIAELRTSGVPDTAISIIGSDGAPHAADGDLVVGSGVEGDRIVDSDGDERLNQQGGLHALRGVLGGGALGALLGVMTVPLVGPFVAAGAIVAAGTGFIIGASTGGIGEILTHHGIAEEDAAFYERELANGGVIVSVVASSTLDAPRIQQIMISSGGRSAASMSAPAAAAVPTEMA